MFIFYLIINLESYYTRGMPISTTHSHKDLGMVINDNLNWNVHHDAILSKAYEELLFLYQPKPNYTYH